MFPGLTQVRFQKKFIEQGFLYPKIGLIPHVPHLYVLLQKWWFCHCHAGFGHFAQIDPTSWRAKFQRAIPFRKKENRGRRRGEGLRTWNFQGYSRKSMFKFKRVIKKKSCGISMGLGYCRWDFQGIYVTQFCRISWGESLFSVEFPRLRWQTWTYHCLVVVYMQVESEFFCLFFCSTTLSIIVSNLSNFLSLYPAPPKKKIVYMFLISSNEKWLTWRKIFEKFTTIPKIFSRNYTSFIFFN